MNSQVFLYLLSIRRPVIELSDDSVGLEHVHEGFGVGLLDYICDAAGFRAGNDGVDNVALAVRIRAFAFKDRGSVVGYGVDRAADLIGFCRYDEKCDLLVFAIQHMYRCGRGKLEDDRIQSFVPAEQNAGGSKDAGVDEQYDIK